MYFAQDKLGSCLSFAKALRTIHINYPPGGSGSPVLPQSQALSFLNKFSPTITQFGCNAQVWQVSSVRWTRGMLLKADGLYCPDIANDRGCWRWFDGSAQDSGPIRESWYSWTVSRRAIIDRYQGCYFFREEQQQKVGAGMRYSHSTYLTSEALNEISSLIYRWWDYNVNANGNVGPRKNK